MSRMGYTKKERPFVKLECLRLLVGLKLNKAKQYLVSGFVDSSLNLSEKEEQTFKQEFDKLEPQAKEEAMEITSSWMREGIKQGIKQGKEKGIEEGRQRGIKEGRQHGIQEGRQQEALKLTLRLLRKRVGALPTDIRKRVETLSLSQLEKLSEALFTLSNINDLTSWLDRTLPESN
jgi:flagellar biosynthesis/type III secretory pathway protein FliH